MSANITFGVRITADNQVFVNGVRASTEEVNKLGEGLKRVSKDADGAAGSQESLTGAVAKGSIAADVAMKAVQFLGDTYAGMKEQTRQAQQEQLRLESVLNATQGAAGRTAEQISELANAMAKATRFDGDGIKKAAAQLAAFGDIAGKTFDRTIKAAGDLAAVFGGDLETRTLQLAKVLTEPGTSLGQFERSFGKFEPEVKKAIANALELNDVMMAQKIILDNLEGRVGGAAVNAYRGLERQIEGTNKAWDDLLKAMGERVFDAQSKDASAFETVLRSLGDTIRATSSDWERAALIAEESGINMFNPLAIPAIVGSAAQQREQERLLAGDGARRPGASADPNRQRAADEFKRLLEGSSKAEKFASEWRHAWATIIQDGKVGTAEASQIIESIVAKYTSAVKRTSDESKTRTEEAYDAAQQVDRMEEEANAEREKGAAFVAKMLSDMNGIVATAEEDVALWGVRSEYAGNIRKARELTKKLEGEIWLVDENQAKAMRDILASTLAAMDARTATIILLKEEKAITEARIEAEKRLGAEIEKQNEQIGQSLTDALFRAFESGEGFGRAFAQTLMNTINAMVLRPIINPISSAVGGAVNAGLSSAGNAVAGYLGYGSIGTASQFVGGLTGAIPAGAIGAEAVAAGVGVDSLSASIGSALLGLGPVGWATIAAATVAAYVGLRDPGPAERQGTFGQVTGDTQGLAYSARSRFSQFGFSDMAWGSDADMKPTITAFLGGLTTFENALYAAIKPDQREAVSTALAGSTRRYSLGTEHEDFGAQLLGIARDRLATIVGAIYPSLEHLIIGFEGTGEELLNFVSGLMRTQQIINAMVDANPMEAATTQFRNAQNGIATALNANNSRMRTLIETFDGTAAGADALTQATNQYYMAQVQLLVQMEEIRQSVAGMFGDTRRSIEMGGLTDQERYNYLQNEADDLYSQVLASTNPEEIQRWAQRINQDILDSFNLLAPEQQRSERENFLSRLDTVSTATQARIASLQTQAAAATRANMDRVADLWEEASTEQKAAAAVQLAAAKLNYENSAGYSPYSGPPIPTKQPGDYAKSYVLTDGG
ncbi:MAG: phage tail length tape measure family protein [Betaproteobacteria bacterium]|nr:phage tail length tape measure family protein [Betaproteobacteria bacterium]